MRCAWPPNSLDFVAMETDETNGDRRKLHVRIPAPLFEALESLRFEKSKKSGRRMSLRQLVEEILQAAVASE